MSADLLSRMLEYGGDMRHAIEPEELPEELPKELDVITVRLPAATDTSTVKPYRAAGCVFAEVRRTDAGEREWVCDALYRADWLGWHRGHSGGYGDTPSAALRALRAHRLGSR